ncbi:MAG: Rid family hydrolase [Fervidobacterium sp.]
MNKLYLNAFYPLKVSGMYSYIFIAGGLVYNSGRAVLYTFKSQLVIGGVIPDIRQVLSNFKAFLTDMNLSRTGVVKMLVFLNDMADFSAINAVYTKYVPANYPSRKAIQVAALSKNTNEKIDVIAYKTTK